ncbi:hypothetical protein B0T20DRAFT_112832 [Sordaria brevicollis]|uniref:Uncharacterized protein n=1 Tax=Sordaria brevicollis TaxID=83679 RepID=A0AAE0PJZ9_SORBR|nr:hypothetical protein B0T20DRAFT_112832 [Sordaria brevicollis]
MPPVPTTSSVLPGTGVNIILKADQPTGRTVSGYVQDVLTKGNHPRGIKVRLTDGRVGRVQSLCSNPETSSEDMGSFGAFEDTRRHGGGRRERGGRGRREYRGEGGGSGGGGYPETQQFGLDAYIKPAKTKGRRGQGQGGSSGEATTTTTVEEEESVCPVCADFRGDATAVAHHVASHFGE